MLKIVYKPVGMTPYELSLKIKKRDPSIKKIAYVYRLDPMAHGEILILINEFCRLTNYYVHLKSYKIYEYSVLFGLNTDTLDILGNITDNQVLDFVRYGYFNVEGRSLMSCFGLTEQMAVNND